MIEETGETNEEQETQPSDHASEGEEDEVSPYASELKKVAKRLVASAVANAVQVVIMEGRVVSSRCHFHYIMLG